MVCARAEAVVRGTEMQQGHSFKLFCLRFLFTATFLTHSHALARGIPGALRARAVRGAGAAATDAVARIIPHTGAALVVGGAEVVAAGVITVV